MNKLSIDEIKATQLKILVAFDSFCKQENLTYWLSYGSLLGAVRHGGFIPWDDDIDVIMPYRDYRKFIQKVTQKSKDGYLSERYRVADYHIGPHMPYHQLFAKIYDVETKALESSLRTPFCEYEGIFIDVFVLSGYPESFKEQESLYSRIAECRKSIFLCATKARFIGFSHPMDMMKHWVEQRRYPVSCMRSLLARYKEIEESLPDLCDSTLCVDISTQAFMRKQYLSSKDWSETIYIEFEGYSLPIPKGYHNILTSHYGDYMTLPQESDRRPTHDQAFYRIN